MIRRIGVAILVTAFVGTAGILLLSRRQEIAPVPTASPSSFSAESVARGETLAAIGHCASCHTHAGGQPFAGGYGVNTPFGIVYGTNITPDSKTGIGTWPFEAFLRAMREGVARDGSHLFPAFPYGAYTKLTDDDLRALYAYLMTRQPVSASVPSNTVPFPLNVRALQEGWKLLFFGSGGFQSNPAKSYEWNRGAYLAEALSDCSGCTLRAIRWATKRLGMRMPALLSTAGSHLRWTGRIPHPCRGHKRIYSASCEPAQALCTVRLAVR